MAPSENTPRSSFEIATTSSADQVVGSMTGGASLGALVCPAPSSVSSVVPTAHKTRESQILPGSISNMFTQLSNTRGSRGRESQSRMVSPTETLKYDAGSSARFREPRGSWSVQRKIRTWREGRDGRRAQATKWSEARTSVSDV